MLGQLEAQQRRFGAKSRFLKPTETSSENHSIAKCYLNEFLEFLELSEDAMMSICG
jgi:hypothetical protein